MRIPPVIALVCVVLTLVSSVAVADPDTGKTEPFPEGADAKAMEWLLGLDPIGVFGDKRLRHAGAITRVEPLSDGKRAIICAGDGTSRLWDLETGEEIRRFVDGTSYVWMALVLPGEKRMLTTGTTGGVTLWDIETGEKLRTYKHGSTTYRVTLAPDGKSFFAVDASDDGIFWELETGKKIRTISPDSQGLYTAIYLEGGKVLATGGDDQILTFWEVETGKKLSEVDDKKNTKDIFTLSKSPDGTKFAMSCEGNTLRLREAKKDGEQIWAKDFPNGVNMVVWSPDGTKLGAACDDHNLYVVNAADGEIEKKMSLGAGSDYAVAFTTDGKEIIGARNNIIFRFDVETGERTFPEADADIMSSGVSAVATHGDKIYVSGSKGKILVFDANDVSSGPSARIAVGGAVMESLSISPDGKTLAAGDDSNDQIVVVDLDEQKMKKTVNIGKSLNELRMLDNSLLALSTYSKEVDLWDLDSGALKTSLSGHTQTVRGLAASEAGDRIASFSDDGTARVWNLETQTQSEMAGKMRQPGVDSGDQREYRKGAFVGERGLLAARDKVLDYFEAPKEETFVPEPEVLDALYADLVSPQFIRRAKATKELGKLGLEALKEIEKRHAEAEGDDPDTEMRIKQLKGRVIKLAKMEDAKGSFVASASFGALDYYEKHGLWIGLVGSSATAEIQVGDIHNGAPRILRKLTDGRGATSFVVDKTQGKIIVGNGDGTVTVWGAEQ